MFSYNIEVSLKKKLKVLAKKDKVLVDIFKKKLKEITSHTVETIDTYKNLKSPLKELKRIHLKNNFVLVFKVLKKERHIIFVDLSHRDNMYK